jgi:hypothetical protein
MSTTRISLHEIEQHVPARLWRVWGIAVMPLRLWQWSTQGSWCWTMDGKPEPLRFRFTVAWSIWSARYRTDWSLAEARP